MVVRRLLALSAVLLTGCSVDGGYSINEGAAMVSDGCRVEALSHISGHTGPKAVDKHAAFVLAFRDCMRRNGLPLPEKPVPGKPVAGN